MTTRYIATIHPHIITRARTVSAGNTLESAKIAATKEFQAEAHDVRLAIYDTQHPDGPEPVAWRRIGDPEWSHGDAGQAAIGE
jgi:hypothetical protein